MTQSFPPKPYLFLDVDGVLNACPPIEGVEVFHVTIEGRRLPICIPPGTKQRVARLAEAFEIVWATTWREQAHATFGEPLGLGEDEWEHLEYFGEYKLPSIIEHAIHRHVRETFCMPWVWIDDNGEREMEHIGIRDDGHRTLVITTNLGEGLTDDQVERALSFAERLRVERDERWG